MSVPARRVLCPVCKDDIANTGSLQSHVSRKRLAGHSEYKDLKICKQSVVTVKAQNQPLDNTVHLQSDNYRPYEATAEVGVREISTSGT